MNIQKYVDILINAFYDDQEIARMTVEEIISKAVLIEADEDQVANLEEERANQ